MLKSSPIALVTGARYSGVVPFDDGIYTADDLPGDPAITEDMLIPFGKANGQRDRSVEVEVFTVSSQVDPIVIDVYAVERVANSLQEGSTFNAYRFRKVGELSCTAGTKTVELVLDSEGADLRWCDTMAFTASDYGTALFAAVGADPVVYSPEDDTVAAFFIPDMGGAFAVLFIPQGTDEVGVMAQRKT